MSRRDDDTVVMPLEQIDRLRSESGVQRIHKPLVLDMSEITRISNEVARSRVRSQERLVSSENRVEEALRSYRDEVERHALRVASELEIVEQFEEDLAAWRSEFKPRKAA